ncbi:MAG: energy transducer TonB [Pseudomonadota bacterium]
MSREQLSRWSIAFALAMGVHAGLLSLISVPKSPQVLLAGGTVQVQFGPRTENSGDKAASEEETTQMKAAPISDALTTETPDSETAVQQSDLNKSLPKAAETPEPEDPSPELEDLVPELTGSIIKPQPKPEPPSPEEETLSRETQSDQAAESQIVETLGGDASDTSNSGESHTESVDDVAEGPSDGGNEAALPSEAATSTQIGNAAFDNYAGEVMRHLSRVRRPRASSPGSAFVRFQLDETGRLMDIEISKSSGSRRFDRDALKVVERAEPYPPPPIGIARTFTVEIEGD